MANRVWLFATIVALTAGPAAAQDARSALQAAATAMGVTNMNSIQVSGAGWQGAVGQNFSPDVDWPRFDLTSYTRTIDFGTQSSRVEMVRRQGNNPGRGGGGTPIVGEQRIVNLVSGNYAWNMQGTTVTPAPAAVEQRQIDILLTPWGFIKGAMAAKDVTAITRNEYGERVTVVSFVALGKYRVNGTINSQNLIQRVQSWLPSPVVGDMYIETVYSNYRDINGLRVPGRWHQHQDFDDGASQPNVSGGDHAFGLEMINDVRVNVADAAITVPEEVRKATIPPVRVESQKLGEGLWFLGGGSHNSVAVEFRDHVAVIEAPLDEDRSLAVIQEVTKLVPKKPIRYVVNTHHHWDHLGGIRTYVHEGATIVTHESNRPYYQEVLRARPWLLKPDRFSLYPPEEWSEGYIFETVREKFILGDDTRTVELHNVSGLGHALGMLIAYIPKEKIVVEADLFTPPAQGATPPAPNPSNRTFQQTLQRLKLDVTTIVPLHGRPVPLAEFTKFMSTAKPATN
jgi:glyoxylase-like metal-dependent hydrolase (beta-lactamase superfamily II)